FGVRFGFVLGLDCGRGLADASAEGGVKVDDFVLVNCVFGGCFGNAGGLVDFGQDAVFIFAEEVRLGGERTDVFKLVGERLVGDHGRAFERRVSNLRGEEADGAESVVVAGDHVVDNRRIAVGIDDRNNRDAELASFGDSDGFVVGVNDEDRVRKAA